MFLSQRSETRTQVEQKKIRDAIAGQRFVLRHTPDLESAYLKLVEQLAPNLAIPDAENNGEA